MGTIVTRAPNCNLSASALLDLTLAVELFEKSAPHSHRARTALAVLRKLKEKAVHSYTELNSPAGPHPNLGSNPVPIPAASLDLESLFVPANHAGDEGEDELALFGGQARILTRKGPRRRDQKSHGGEYGSDTPSPVSSSSVAAEERATNNPTPVDADNVSGDSRTGEGLQNMEVDNLGLAFAPPNMPDVHPSLMQFLNGQSGNVMNYEQTQAHRLAQQPYNGYPILPRLGDSQPPSQQEVPPVNSRELYAGFLEYLATRGNLNSTSNISRFQSEGSQSGNHVMTNLEQEQQERLLSTERQTTRQGDAPALPQTIVQPHFGWTPSSSFMPQASMQHGQYGFTPSPLLSMNDMNNQGPYHSQQQYDSLRVLPTSVVTDEYLSNRNPMAVELGLLTESGMDAGWSSFMRECGIIDYGRRA